MSKIGEAFYGRAQAYQAALDTPGDQALADTIARNIFGGVLAEPAAARRLAAYVRQAVGDLRAQSAASLAAGELRFPDPAAAV
jgi:cytochrome b pre-mRNA-processing protein 3